MKNPNVLIGSDYGQIIININDSGVGRNISRAGYHSISDINLIIQLIDFLLQKKEHVNFYDVGANIGTHSLAIGKKYGEKISVRAFEAQRQIFYMLCGTIALNGLANVNCHNLAVSHMNGDLIKIPLPNYNEINNFGGLELIKPVRTDNHEMIQEGFDEVRTVTLDSFDENVDFIKMDIEGMEDKALAGSRLILEKSRPICFVEILKTDVSFLTKLFHELGYIGFQKDADLIAIPLEYQVQIGSLKRIF